LRDSAQNTNMTQCRSARTTVATVVVFLISACGAAGQEFQIGIIDLYGLSRVPADQVRGALTFKEGDTISLGGGERPAFLAASENRVALLPGVVRARTNVVCCEQGRAIVYVGVEEAGATTLQFRAAPLGAARLAPDIVQSGEEFSKALRLAVQRGDAGEDRSEGHAFNHDPAGRAVQERFLVYARRDLPTLRLVLRSSSDAAHRALAAQVLGYTTDKQTVVEDLVYGMTDPSEEVRNNAMRTLLVFADTVPSVNRPSTPRIPLDPFIEFLNSPVWSDRNKASGALLALSAHRDAELLAKLRKQALGPLVEMARWKSAGHALAAFIMLARIAGYSDETAFALWERGDREAVISAAIKGRQPAV
jgi:HEAT repeats